MRDVARHAGVSVATVSRVMSGASNVAGATQAKVQRAIDTLEFVPSAAARAINSGRTYMVGALVPTLDHAIFSRFLDALELTLAEHGFSLVVATTNDDPEREAQRALDLLNLGVEGFVVSGITRCATFGALIKRHKTPVIATSYFDPDSETPTIGYDNGTAAQQALQHLIDMGHEDILVLSGPAWNNDRTKARLDALTGCTQARLTVREIPVTVAAAADHVAAIPAPITALLCLSDVLAQGAMHGLRRRGLEVPDDISVIGIDDLPSSQSLWPPLSSVHLPVRRMGACAGETLARWIETGERAAPINLETRLEPRASVRRITPA